MHYYCFRVGSFYETFGATTQSKRKILDIILTKRGAGSESETELAGFLTIHLRIA